MVNKKSLILLSFIFCNDLLAPPDLSALPKKSILTSRSGNSTPAKSGEDCKRAKVIEEAVGYLEYSATQEHLGKAEREAQETRAAAETEEAIKLLGRSLNQLELELVKNPLASGSLNASIELMKIAKLFPCLKPRALYNLIFTQQLIRQAEPSKRWSEMIQASWAEAFEDPLKIGLLDPTALRSQLRAVTAELRRQERILGNTQLSLECCINFPDENKAQNDRLIEQRKAQLANTELVIKLYRGAGGILHNTLASIEAGQ